MPGACLHWGGRRLQQQEERADREAEKVLREAKARRVAEEKTIRETEALRAAGEKAFRETEARKAAEAEVARLRAELERLRGN